MGLKKSIVHVHIASAKHLRGINQLKFKKKEERDLALAWESYKAAENPVGVTLPTVQSVCRIRCLRHFLCAGIGLTKIDKLRGLLQENAYSLTGSQHMRELIPFINQQELNLVKSEIADRFVSVIIDETAHVTEEMVIIVRYVNVTSEKWVIEQHIARLLPSKSLTGEEVAHQLITTLSTQLGIQSHLLLGEMHDCVSVNNVAMRTLKIVC